MSTLFLLWRPADKVHYAAEPIIVSNEICPSCPTLEPLHGDSNIMGKTLMPTMSHSLRGLCRGCGPLQEHWTYKLSSESLHLCHQMC